MDETASSQLFRADHVKKHSYHLIIHRNDSNKPSKTSEELVNDNKDVSNDLKNVNSVADSIGSDYSVAVLGQHGYVLDYGEIKYHNPAWKLDKIFRKYKNDVILDDQAVIDASLDVESEFISQRFYLNSMKSPTQNSIDIKNVDQSNECTLNADNNDSINISNNTSYSNSNEMAVSKDDVKYVLDCTCGVGGNLIHLAENFICIGIEITSNRSEICKHNLRVYGLENRAVVVNADMVTFLDSIDFNNPQSFKDFGIDVTKPPFDMLPKQRFSWVLISPPWGGSDYPGSTKTNVTYRLDHITTLDIRDVVIKAAAISTNVSLILPKSQNIPDLIHLSQLTNLPFVTIDLIYMSTHNPLPRLCCVHFTNHLMDKCGRVKFRKLDMKWDVADITECVNIAIPINYNHGKINLISPLSTNSVFDGIHTSSFSRALGEAILCAIGEHMHSLPRLIDIIELLGLKEIQLLLQDTNEIYNSGGMTYTLDGVTKNRTLGGIFFYLIKIRHQSIYRHVEKKHKFRKIHNHQK